MRSRISYRQYLVGFLVNCSEWLILHFLSTYWFASFVIPVPSLLPGVKNVEVDLSNQVVRILGSTPVKTMTEALEQTGRRARLIGQGVPEGWPVKSLMSCYAFWL